MLTKQRTPTSPQDKSRRDIRGHPITAEMRIDKKGEVSGYPKSMPSEAEGSPLKAMARVFTEQNTQKLKLLPKGVNRASGTSPHTQLADRRQTGKRQLLCSVHSSSSLDPLFKKPDDKYVKIRLGVLVQMLNPE
ncbi:hypothetical protein MG293_014274 [Ovis ammon polii]|uniref:Uncharacterized protein n=1 Tax=Ovis ammon polii TaxID=230172 RepID=A0AAD4Y688_OVIAM|nr:hypothetical protein MG293_014274 [Ovis ammon polii]